MADHTNQAANNGQGVNPQQMPMVPGLFLSQEMLEQMRQNGPQQFMVNPAATPQLLREYQQLAMAQWGQPPTTANSNLLYSLGYPMPNQQHMQDYLELLRQQAAGLEPAAKPSPKKTPRKGQLKTQEDEYASNVPSLHAEQGKRSSRNSGGEAPAKRPSRKSKRVSNASSTSNKQSQPAPAATTTSSDKTDGVVAGLASKVLAMCHSSLGLYSRRWPYNLCTLGFSIRVMSLLSRGFPATLQSIPTFGFESCRLRL
eukprot:m.187743 g.187743  ORF g.187743 m.187743 type:complete len:256 (+) comp16934_c1_seq6:21-788(+)